MKNELSKDDESNASDWEESNDRYNQQSTADKESEPIQQNTFDLFN